MPTTSAVAARLACNLKVMRAWKKQTQPIVAAALGVKRSSYNGYENGAAEPNLEVLARIQEHYGVGIDLLLTSELAEFTEFALGQIMRGSTPARRLFRHNATITD